MAIGIAQPIIRKCISDQMTMNIIDQKNPKKIWDQLKYICIEIGQRVIYFILQELLHYPKIIKSKKYKKPVMQIFAKIEYLCKYLHKAMILIRDPKDMIAIIFHLTHCTKTLV